MTNLATYLERADATAKNAITLIDSDFAQAPTIPDTTGMSAGQILEARSKSAGEVHPLVEIKKIRARFYRRMQEAKGLLDRAEREVAGFEALSKYLRTGFGDMSALDPQMQLAARSAKSASDAGLIDAASIADQVDYALKDARAKLHQERLHVRALEATGVLAANAQAGNYLGRNAGFEFMQHGFEKRADRIRAARIERNRLSKNAKARLSGKAAPKPAPKKGPAKKRKIGEHGARMR